jgi:hypothetical protein
VRSEAQALKFAAKYFFHFGWCEESLRACEGVEAPHRLRFLL